MASGLFLERPFWYFEGPIRIPYKPLDILSQHLRPPQGPTRAPLEPHWNPTTFIRSCSHYLETILLGLKIPNLLALLIHTHPMSRFGLLLQMALFLFCLKYHYQIRTQPLSNREVQDDMQQPLHLGDVQMIRFNQFCNAPNARQEGKVHIHRNNLLQSHLLGMRKKCGHRVRWIVYRANASEIHEISWNLVWEKQKLELPHAQALAKQKCWMMWMPRVYSSQG